MPPRRRAYWPQTRSGGHRSRPPVVALCEPGRVGRDIELEVAGDLRTAGADGFEAAGVRGLRRDERRLCGAGPDQGIQSLVTLLRSGRGVH